MPCHFISRILLPALLLSGTLGLHGQDGTPYKPSAYPSGTAVNFVRTWEARFPTTDPNALLFGTMPGITQATQYVDGLGRPLQTVVRKGSMVTGDTARDLVSPVNYDDFGRESRKYLPFAASDDAGGFKLDPFDQQKTFYDARLSGQGETFYYSKTDYETSPLNRVIKVYAPGNSWVHDGRGVAIKYWSNTLTDAVRIWRVTDVANDWGTYATTGVYAAGTLYKTVTVDENNKQTIEFKDKEGQVVLKKVQLTAASDDGLGQGYTGWLCTYYIYDDLNRLRAVIQPKGVERLIAYNWDVNAEGTTILVQQFFRYEYDARNRMIRKKTPGLVENRMVYDARDRLVMTQDRRLNSSKQWLYTKYDALNRVSETGIMKDNTHYNDLAYHLGEAYGSTDYPNLSNFTEVEVLTKTFYDNYNWRSTEGNPLNGTFQTLHNILLRNATGSFPYAEAPVATTGLIGMATGTKTKIVGTTTYIYSIPFYDEKGRMIQVQSTNMTGGTDIATTQYSFSGQPLTVVQQTQKNGTNPQTHTVKTLLDYDDLGRLSTIKKQVTSTVNGQTVTKAEQLIATNEYDALGQLVKKTLGTGTLENMNYVYNIRGWLTSLNKDFVEGGSSHYFGMELGYDKTTATGDAATNATLQYNGNIARSSWRSKGDGVARQYDFTYDNVNRLTGAPFLQNTSGSSWDKTTVDFSVSNLDYDANGNIQHMKQMGIQPAAAVPVTVDNLLYTYNYNSNQLKNVIDSSNDATTVLGDFRTSTKYLDSMGGIKTTGATDYTYDATGNLAQDLNKDINVIGYSPLNLPTYVSFLKPDRTVKGSISYVYDANGIKVKKTVNETGKPAKTTLYLNGLVFEDDVLQFIPHEEGRIRFTPATGSAAAKFDYDYFLKDHLGNVRMVLTEEQQQAIYPAATLEGSLSTAGSPNAAYVEKNYYTMDASHIVVKPSTVPDYPNNNGAPPVNNNPNSVTTATSQQMYQLQATSGGAATGLGITLKVMSGDKIDIFGKSYYQVNNTTATNYSLPVEDLLGGFLGGPSGIGTAKGVTAAGLNAIPEIATAVGSYLNAPERGSGTMPKAYINYLLLDEQFRYVGGGFSRVGAVSTLKDHYADLQNIPVTKNGYIYVYCSNESPVQVFFDNLQVVHTKGPVLEETHYYPFGLIMAGISSKALGQLENKKKFNGIELNNDFDINVYDAFYRNLDPQIGRFWEIDPKIESAEAWSPYSATLDNPIRFADPLGDSSIKPWPARVGGQVASNPFVTTSNDNKDNSKADASKSGGNKSTIVKQTGDKGEVKPLFGSTSTNVVTNEREIIPPNILGDRISLSTSAGTVSGNEGSILTGNINTNNSKIDGASVTILGALTIGANTDLSVSGGISIGHGADIHGSFGLGMGLGQYSLGKGYTTESGITGSKDVTVRPGLGTLALAILLIPAAALAF